MTELNCIRCPVCDAPAVIVPLGQPKRFTCDEFACVRNPEWSITWRCTKHGCDMHNCAVSGCAMAGTEGEVAW